MPDDLKAEALSKIHKQCIGCVEQYMKLLEYLDSLVTATFSCISSFLVIVITATVYVLSHNLLLKLFFSNHQMMQLEA